MRGTFILIVLFFLLFIFSTRLSDTTIPAILALATGAFAAYLVLILTGILREFTFKAAFVEVSSKLEEKIEKVESNVTESTEEVKEKIRDLTQNIQTMNIANRFTANPSLQVTKENFQDRLESQLRSECGSTKTKIS